MCGQKCLTFSTFLTFFVGSECWILGTKWLPMQVIHDSVISVILAGVTVTSQKWRCSNDIFAFLLEVSCTVGNAYETWISERNACVSKWKRDETGSKWIRNCSCGYYNNNVQPIGACFTVTHFHKLFSLFNYLREKCYRVSPLVIPGNAGYPC
jgi:hypothetical protein